MTNEKQKVYDRLVDAFQATNCLYDLQRHEDSHSTGIPDVSYGISGVNGWIELKHTHQWPSIYRTKLRETQGPWLIRRGIAAGNCYLLHKIDSTYLLFGYWQLKEIEGTQTTKIRTAALWSGRSLEDQSFFDIITTRQHKPHDVLGLIHI